MLSSKDIALLERDWDPWLSSKVIFCLVSKDIALLERDWDRLAAPIGITGWCRKTSPCSKGIETYLLPFYVSAIKSKDIALLERDWDASRLNWFSKTCTSKDIALLERDWDSPTTTIILGLGGVERHRPARKGLRLYPCLVLRNYFRSRKTSPCSKGIETRLGSYLRTLRLVERHRPARKGLRLT